MTMTLRPYCVDDRDFLFLLYSDVRKPEIAGFGWPEAQIEMFLRMQFNAQCSGYEAGYPQAEHHIILVDEQPVGRILIDAGNAETGTSCMTLVDIAIMAAHRNQGIGAQLIGSLLERSNSNGFPVRLQVLRPNTGAYRLYEKLGFQKIGEDQMYFQMERKPQ